MRYGEDTGQVVKMRERGAQTVQGCEQAQCSRRGSDIRDMEIIREMENIPYTPKLSRAPTVRNSTITTMMMWYAPARRLAARMSSSTAYGT